MLIYPDEDAAIAAPIIMSQRFGYFASDPAPVYFPGSPFFVAGVLVLLAILIFQRVVTIVASTA